jgi:hypothetical protein
MTRISGYRFAWTPLPLDPTRRSSAPLTLGATGQPRPHPEPLTALASLLVRARAHARVPAPACLPMDLFSAIDLRLDDGR